MRRKRGTPEPVESALPAPRPDHKQRWAEAKERYVANGDAQELAYEAGLWLEGEPILGITFSVAIAAVEISGLMIARPPRVPESVAA